MRKQRNMFQMKGQDIHPPPKKNNEMEISHLPDKEFKVVVINVLTKLRRNMGKE